MNILFYCWFTLSHKINALGWKAVVKFVTCAVNKLVILEEEAKR